MTATLAQRAATSIPARAYDVAVASGPLTVEVLRASADLTPTDDGLTMIPTAALAAAGYAWHVVADHADDGSPRVRVTCHGRRVSTVFDRWQYPRADVWAAVADVAVRALTGAARADLAPLDGLRVGRAVLPDHQRGTTATVGRWFIVADLL